VFLALSFPLDDFVVDEIDNRKQKRCPDDQHDEGVGNPAKRGDPGREDGQTGEQDEPGQVEQAWTVDAPQFPSLVCALIHPSEAITRKLVVQRTTPDRVAATTSSSTVTSVGEPRLAATAGRASASGRPPRTSPESRPASLARNPRSSAGASPPEPRVGRALFRRLQSGALALRSDAPTHVRQCPIVRTTPHGLSRPVSGAY
jgi:hypothetical protein